MLKNLAMPLIIFFWSLPYSYSQIYSPSEREKRVESLVAMNSKGKFYITLGYHIFNGVKFTPPEINQQISEIGFLGLSLGGEYFYSDLSSISVEFDLTAAVFMDYVGTHDIPSQFNFQAYHNTNFKRITFGYGINVSYNMWNYNYVEEYNEEIDIINDNSLYGLYESVRNRFMSYGFYTSCHYKLSSAFRFGLIYRPSFYKIRHVPGIKYAESICFDFKFHVNTGKRLRPNVNYVRPSVFKNKLKLNSKID